MPETGAEFNLNPDTSVQLPDYESVLKPISPNVLLDKWETIRPWEPKTPGMGTKMWNRMTIRSHLNKAIPEIKPGEDKIIAEGQHRDVRGWILKELGVSDEMINNPPLDPLEAQKLIAKGLGISHFHAALLDRATRNTREEETDENFIQALTHPELFANEKLSRLATEIENLDRPGWERAYKVELPNRINVLGLEKDEEWMKKKGENEMVYQKALVDVATAALKEKFGRKDPPEKEALRTLKVLAMQIKQGKVVSAGVGDVDEVHKAINEAGGSHSKADVTELLGNLAEERAKDHGDMDKWEKEFENPDTK